MSDIESLRETLRELRQQFADSIATIDAALNDAPRRETPLGLIDHIILYLREHPDPHTDTDIVNALLAKDEIHRLGHNRPSAEIWKSIQFNTGERGPLICVERVGERFQAAKFRGLEYRTKEQKALKQYPGNLIMLRSQFRE